MSSPTRYSPLFALVGLLTLLGVALPGWAQTGTVTGTVIGAQSQNALPGANVVVVGTNIGTAVNQNGRYRLGGVPAGEQTLRASYLGYQSLDTTITVAAGETTSLDFTLQSRVLQGGEVLVQGARRGQVKALARKQEAPQLMDVVSADEIGKLPDQNVAEAIQRLPGITMQVDKGEGRFVTIRGTSPELNSVKIDGHALASSAESRATALDLLPADMVSSVEVVKAITPDMDGNAIGGTVNVTTLTAFDRQAPFIFGSMNALRHQQVMSFGDDRFPYRANLTAGTRFGEDRAFGLVVSASASLRDYKSSESQPEDYIPVNGHFAPESFGNFAIDTQRERYGLNANLDYRPSDETQLYLRSYYSRTDENNNVREFGYDIIVGDPTSVSARSGQFPEGEAELETYFTQLDEYLVSVSGGAEHTTGSITIDGNATYTRGFLDRWTDKYEFPNSADPTLFGSSYDWSGTDATSFRLTPDNPQAVSDPSNYVFDEIDEEAESNVEDTYMGEANLRWDGLVSGNPAYLKFGSKAQVRTKVIDDIETGFNGGSAPASLSRFATDPIEMSQGFRMPINGDFDAVHRFAQQNRDNTQYLVPDLAESQQEAVENDSDNREEVYAGYGMGNVDFGALNLIGGLRVEHTRTQSTRWQLEFNLDDDEQELGQETDSNSYTSYLPSLHLKLTPAENLLLRGAYSTTIGRPDYEELASFREVSFSESVTEEGEFDGSVQEGNPDLTPYHATNFDLTAEYYFSSGGIFSVGGFYKQIDNPIYTFERIDRDIQFEGRFFDELSYEQPRNADQGTIKGFEASYQQFLFFLPPPLDGLGISSNLALMSSSVDVPSRPEEDLPFFGQSDTVYNLIPFFQRAGFELRVAINYQSAYLDELGDEAYEDVYVDARRTIDVTGRYSFLDDLLQITGQIRNLTNEPETGYQGVEERYNRHIVTGRTFVVGLSFTI